MSTYIKKIPLFLTIFLVQCNSASNVKVVLLPYNNVSTSANYQESLQSVQQKYADKYFSVGENGYYEPKKPFDNLFSVETYRMLEISYQADNVDCFSKMENKSQINYQSDSKSFITKLFGTNEIVTTQTNSSLATGNLISDAEQSVLYLKQSELPNFSLDIKENNTQKEEERYQIEHIDDEDITIDLKKNAYSISNEFKYLTPKQRTHQYAHPAILHLYAAILGLLEVRANSSTYYVDDELFTVARDQEETPFDLTDQEMVGTMKQKYVSQINYQKLSFITRIETFVTETVNNINYHISETIQYRGYIGFPDYNFRHIDYKKMSQN